MNDYTIIFNYLKGNPTYTFELSGYILPKYIDRTNLYESRKIELLEHTSSYCKNFEKDVNRFIKDFGNKDYLDYIKEFPIPIDHKKYWLEILDDLGLPEKHKSRFTDFFKLDYIFPSLGIVIEIDSTYHFNRALYDLARDTYLSSVFGLKLVRLLNYGETKANWNINYPLFTSEFREAINHKKSQGISSSNKVSLDFSISISQNYIRQNKLVFDYIVKLRKDLGIKFVTLKTIDIKKDSNYSKNFWIDLESVLKHIYKKSIRYVV